LVPEKKSRKGKMIHKRVIFYFRFIIYLGILIIFLGCGKKGPPVPWDSIVPKRILNLEAIPREGRLLLEWTSPKENTDKSPLIDLAGFRIFRAEGILINGQCRGCTEKTNLIREIKLDPKEDNRGKRISIFINDQEPKKVYVYQVVSVNRRGYLSSPSNPVTVYWDDPPDFPKKISGEAGDKRIDLYWEAVNGATGYNIYRKTEGEEFLNKPINSVPIKVTYYTDLNVENDKKYFYSVRALKRVVTTDIEGIGSSEIAIIPTDLIPPASPQGLVAIPLKNGIELNWKRNEEPDLLGYYIYRRRVGEKEFKRINETPIKKETYLDTEVEIEQDYEYIITAVDNSPRSNESPRSEEVRVKYRY